MFRLAAGLSVLVVLAGCSTPEQIAQTIPHIDDYGTPVGARTVQQGGDLVMALSNEPDRLDPTTSSSLYTRYVMNTICEKLYDVDLEGRVVPQLATALPDFSGDGLTATIPVRTGVHFADGTAFDATAVQTSLQRHYTAKNSQRTGEMGAVAGIEAADPTHVVIRFKQPFAPITAALADRAGMIMSPAVLTKDGDNFGDHPVCVGPFKFAERQPGVSITVIRDPQYYDAQHVYLDSITYRITADPTTRAAHIRSGEVQVADQISPADVDTIATESDLHLLQSGSLGFQGITINMGNADGVGKPVKPLETALAKDPRVRLALSLSVDRKQLVDDVFHNWFEPACSPIAPQSPFATRNTSQCPQFDPERAKALLTEAGVALPYPITLHVMNNSDQLHYAQALQASVAQGGFEVKIVPVDYTTLLEMQKRGNFEALMLGWSGRLDPDGNITRFFATGSNGNYGGFSSQTLDDLLAWAARSGNVGQRAALYEQAVQALRRDNPYIYTYRLRNLTVHSTRVTGIEVFPDGAVRLGRAAFVADRKN
ncbi:ABC transporter substrate-binding protein [Nocardia panacis]|uniref:ABC transporter substrate-binding protein n=1 Tax=Nocardia panacis TaxID=2340916 RepID=UPI001EF01B08|nr:ABC transporter substrate-binding protein [Nocardia panacis]